MADVVRFWVNNQNVTTVLDALGELILRAPRASYEVVLRVPDRPTDQHSANPPSGGEIRTTGKRIIAENREVLDRLADPTSGKCLDCDHRVIDEVERCGGRSQSPCKCKAEKAYSAVLVDGRCSRCGQLALFVPHADCADARSDDQWVQAGCDCGSLNDTGGKGGRGTHKNSCSYVLWCDQNGLTRPDTFADVRLGKP